MGNHSTEIVPRAPGQYGGPAWKGPRVALIARVDPVVASVVRQLAQREGVPISEFIAATLARTVNSKT
jgi:hypothetical protein